VGIRSGIVGCALFLLSVAPCCAGEVGNVIGSDPNTEKLSRVASAEVISGIEKIWAGLRERELGGSGQAQFDAAASTLRNAASEMDPVLATLGDTKLTGGQMDFLGDRSQNAEHSVFYPDFRASKSIDDVYRSFKEATLQLADRVKDAHSQPSAFSWLLPAMIQYFRLANDIAELKDIK
jgi:hypothetical protein